MIHPTHGVRICSVAQIRVFLSISGFPAGDEVAVLESHASRIQELRVDNAKLSRPVTEGLKEISPVLGVW